MRGLSPGSEIGSSTFTVIPLLAMAIAATAASVPRITNIIPPAAGVGGLVIISGESFSPVPAENTVFFGAVRATVVDATSTNLAVTVPAGASYARITATTGGLTASAPQRFLPTFSGDLSPITIGTFAPGFNLPAGDYPTPVVVGDVDNDGRPDLVVGNGQSRSIGVYRNVTTNAALSAASFETPVSFSAPFGPYKLALADVDGDGKLDLVASGVNSDQLVIWHNASVPGTISSNSFSAPVLLQTGQDSRFAQAADLDGDGRIDLVSANYGSSTISLFRNIGVPGTITSESFAARIDLPTGTGPYGLDIGDLDGDGRPDLAVVNTGSSISLFRNVCTNGVLDAEAFAAREDLPAFPDGDTIAIADVDADGKPDLVAGFVHPLKIAVFRNQTVDGPLSTNSFALPASFTTDNWVHNVAMADLNGDGKPDIGVAGELPSHISVFQNLSAPGAFGANSLAARVDLPTGWNAWGLTINDLDGDGRPDLVFANTYDDTVTVYRNIAPFAGPPVILIQPTNQTVALGETAAISLQASGSADLAYQWWKGGSPLEGATNSAFVIAAAQLADGGDYSAVVSNSFGSVTSLVAVLSVTNLAPYIITQPKNLNALLNGTAGFSVTAGGNRPLSFQWRFNGTNLPGAIGSALSVTNVQLRDAGVYAVEVSNALGSTLSSNAVLNVITPAATLLVRDTTTPSGWPVTVPILLVANGNENAVSFSINFWTQSRNQLLRFFDASLGDGAAGGTLVINTNLLANGLLGIAVALPAGEVFSPGTQEVAQVTFDTSVITFEQLTTTVLSFGDSPIARQLTDAQAVSLPIVFSSGRIVLTSSDVEGDASPRPGGNRSLTLNDWVQAGRFAAGLDLPADGSEFQRADCAPRSTRGDGRIKVTDWVQTGRYFANLDPLTAVGGPVAPSPAKAFSDDGPVGGPGIRQVIVGDVAAVQGASFEVAVLLEAQGDENALGFSLLFNPAQLEFRSAVAGVGATSASLNLNSMQSGRLGFVLALPIGSVFSAGRREVVRISFVAAPGAVGSIAMAFADVPVLRAVSDVVASELPSEYIAGNVEVRLPPSIRITPAGDDAIISWPAWAGNLSLQVRSDLNSPAGWTNLVMAPSTNGTDLTVRVPLTGESRFFRLAPP